MLSVRSIQYAAGERHILQGIDLFMPEGQRLAIMGETGSGKSTLLKVIAGLLQPQAGRVDFEEEKVLGPDEQLIPGHPGIGYLSQHADLRNNYRVEEVLEYANLLGPGEAEHIFRICRIDHLLKRWTNGNLSGGEKQRVATARLLVNRPRLLLLDEPYSHLDLNHRQTMKQVLQEASEQLGISYLLVSHDPADVLGWADRVVLLRDGLIEQEGTPEEVYQFPQNVHCAGLLGPYHILPGALATRLSGGQYRAYGEEVLVRPGQFFVSDDAGGEEARVIQGIYQGSYVIYEAMLDGQMITFHSTYPDMRPGSSVRLMLRPFVG